MTVVVSSFYCTPLAYIYLQEVVFSRSGFFVSHRFPTISRILEEDNKKLSLQKMYFPLSHAPKTFLHRLATVCAPARARRSQPLPKSGDLCRFTGPTGASSACLRTGRTDETTKRCISFSFRVQLTTRLYALGCRIGADLLL